MNFKPHQYLLIVFLVGLLCGATLHYFFNSQNVDYIKKVSYEEGYQEGALNTTNTILKNFQEADSVYIGQNSMKFYIYEQPEFKLTSE